MLNDFYRLLVANGFLDCDNSLGVLRTIEIAGSVEIVKVGHGIESAVVIERRRG